MSSTVVQVRTDRGQLSSLFCGCFMCGRRNPILSRTLRRFAHASKRSSGQSTDGLKPTCAPPDRDASQVIAYYRRSGDRAPDLAVRV